MDERILCLPADHVGRVANFEGFLPADHDAVQRLLDPRELTFRRRRDVEDDPSFKQLIPYVVLTCREQVFHYRRGAQGTETRLRALRSLGIGGHISEADAAGAGDPYANGLARELAEEVTHAAILSRTLLGFIYDPTTPVGAVHLGVAHRYELVEPQAAAREDALADAGWMTLTAAQAMAVEFETWSRWLLERCL
jgi:predicted NUDIX family phosphoesterase